jgi:hypothetical protein
VFGTVGERESCVVFLMSGDRAVAPDDAVSEIVAVKEFGSERKAATVTLTTIRINRNLHDAPLRLQ